MIQFKYDGSFEGFLSAVFYSFESKIEPDKFVHKLPIQNQLFTQEISIASNERCAQRVWNGIVNRTSKRNADMIYRVFLSELDNIEILLLNYIRLTFGSTRNIEADFGDPVVLEVHNWHKKVMREAERVLMFVRFQKTADNIYYSPFQPRYNVLPISIKHFKDRYADQKWMIYDVDRAYGYYYDLHDIQEVRFTNAEFNVDGKIDKSILNTEEALYQDLWKNYFESTTIQERRNMRLHVQHLPKRFWKYLPEKK